MRKRVIIFFIAAVSCMNILHGQLKFTNPILAGFYPDPSICRAGNDYYIVTSSFAYFPGLPIFHSIDLVNWKQVGHAMDRNSQLDHTNAGVSRGLFAPTIRYNKGTFYIICTLIDKGGNFIITAKDPKGPWSDPVWLPQVDGIDPSIYFENDNTYITYNSIPPDNKPFYNGHRTIRIIAFDLKQMKTIGDNKIIVNGGVDISKKPVWIEAPHIFKKNGWYYLICAEGGTAYNHSEVVFRSRNVDGPYVPSENNPILTQRHLDPNRNNPVTTAGHADLIETPAGEWYAVFLACRPYRDDHYNIGRETFMAPVEWINEWPVINPGFEAIQYSYPAAFSSTTKISSQFSGNFLFKDFFDDPKLSYRYIFLRNPENGIYRLANSSLSLPLKTTTVAQKKNPAFVGFRQSHHKGYAATSVRFNAADDKEKAGLLIFQNEKHYYFLCKSVKNNKPVIQLIRSGETEEVLAEATLDNDKPVNLKIQANNDTYTFCFSQLKNEWTVLKEGIDATFLSTKTAGGFVGCIYAMYATSNGIETKNTAVFDWFEYKGDDNIFRSIR